MAGCAGGGARGGRVTRRDVDVIQVHPARIEQQRDLLCARSERHREADGRPRLPAARWGDFASADKIRDELLNGGVILEDTKAGTRWKRK